MKSIDKRLVFLEERQAIEDAPHFTTGWWRPKSKEEWLEVVARNQAELMARVAAMSDD